MAKEYHGLISGPQVVASGKTLSECRKKCVSYLRSHKRIKIAIWGWIGDDYDQYMGEIYLNWHGKGIYTALKGGQVYSWVVDKNGNLGEKEPYMMYGL